MFILILDEDRPYPMIIDRPFSTYEEAFGYVSKWVGEGRAWRITSIPSR